MKLWRSDTNKRVKTYHLNTVTYGAIPKLFLAITSFYKLAKQEHKNYSFDAKFIKNDFYVNDFLTGSSIISEAIRLRNIITIILRKKSFDLWKQAANVPVLLGDT